MQSARVDPFNFNSFGFECGYFKSTDGEEVLRLGLTLL